MSDTNREATCVKSIIESSRSATLYVLPTTPDVVSIISELRTGAKSVEVIAPLLPECLDAARFLALLKDAHLDRSTACISFPDQLTSAIDAPVPVESDGKRTYYPAVELIANGCHSFALQVWAAGGFRRVEPNASPHDVMSALQHHFRSCETLGDEWQLRAAQRERTHAERVANARLRLRAFQSALMHALPHGLTPEQHRIAAALQKAERKL